MKRNRLIHLEYARGVASILVIFHHFSLAFYPELRLPVWEGGIGYTPLFALVNGDGAIAFFFTLSGFVLTVRFYERFSPAAFAKAFWAAVAKRLPRLMIPAAASILLGLLLLEFAGDPYRAAAEFSASQWLRDFGNAGMPAGLEPSVLDALRQAVSVFLLPGDYYYNSNLWTMSGEFYGSLLVFGVAFWLGAGRPRKLAHAAAVHVGLAAILWPVHPLLAQFLVGSFLAFLWATRGREIRIGAVPAGALVLGAALCLSSGHGAATTVASLLLMVALLGNRSLATRLSGRVGSVLGAVSFPLYLVHTLVILSASSLVYAQLSAAAVPGVTVALATLLTTLAVSAVACVPFAILDARWTAWLNAAVSALADRVLAVRQDRAGAPPAA